MDFSKVESMYDNATIIRMYDSHVENMYDFSEVKIVLNKSSIKNMYEESKVREIEGSGKVVNVGWSKTFGTIYTWWKKIIIL